MNACIVVLKLLALLVKFCVCVCVFDDCLVYILCVFECLLRAKIIFGNYPDRSRWCT